MEPRPPYSTAALHDHGLEPDYYGTSTALGANAGRYGSANPGADADAGPLDRGRIIIDTAAPWLKSSVSHREGAVVTADLIILEPTELLLPYAELGEGPLWDAGTQSLYWVDIPAHLVHRMDGSGAHTSWDVGMPVGAVVRRTGGGLCVAAGDGFYAVDLDTAAVTEIAKAPGLPGTRMNDGACDRAGRFYAGSMADDEAPGRGTFYQLDTDHTVTPLYSEIGISNGVGWSPDDRLMYYIDSLAYQVDVMDYDIATGQVGERRPFVRLGSGEMVPDGLAVDADGGVWAAVWGGSVIQRYDAAGRLTAVVRLSAAHVTSCAFGGPDLDQLYITTAAGPGRSAGALFTCPAGVKGLPAFPYRG